MMIKSHLKSIRESRGMKASTLATQAGVARQTIYAIESGSFIPNTAVALQLAQALDVPVEQLFTMEAAEAHDHTELQAELLDQGAPISTGMPVRLCRVGERLISTPVQVSPAWLPGANAVIDRRISSRSVAARYMPAQTELNRNLLIAGCDPAISILSRFLIRSDGIDVAAVECSSRRALELLKSGKVHIAGMHLKDPKTGEFNLPYVQRTFPKGGALVVTYSKWEQGFVVSAGNPLGIKSAGDLTRAKVTIVNRQVGAGSRELLDRLLKAAGVDRKRVRGYERECSGHLLAAQAVAAGQASCCIATRNAAALLGLGFVALTEERYDFVTTSALASEQPVKALLDAMNRGHFRRQISAIGGYDSSETGSVRG